MKLNSKNNLITMIQLYLLNQIENTTDHVDIQSLNDIVFLLLTLNK